MGILEVLVPSVQRLLGANRRAQGPGGACLRDGGGGPYGEAMVTGLQNRRDFLFSSK
jgi:hypothetical protein